MKYRTFLWLSIAASSTLGLMGCNNRNTDAFDDVGETRVFDNAKTAAAASTPSDRRIAENVPAPQPVTEVVSAPAPKPAPVLRRAELRPQRTAVLARYDRVGEMDVDN